MSNGGQHSAHRGLSGDRFVTDTNKAIQLLTDALRNDTTVERRLTLVTPIHRNQTAADGTSLGDRAAGRRKGTQ